MQANKTQKPDKITFLGDMIYMYILKMEATGSSETLIPIYLLQ